jgi:hypothetical protein
MMRMLGVVSAKKVHVVEANLDLHYGNNKNPFETLEGIMEHMAANPELDLIEAAKQVNAAPSKEGRSGGKNLLGEILTKIFTEYQGKTYAEFLAASRRGEVEEHAAKRVCLSPDN